MTILFIGRSTLDLGYVCPRFPEEDAKLSSEAFTMAGGGPALNAAVAANALGSRTQLASVVGLSPLAQFVKDELDDFGIQLFDLAADAANALPVSSIIVVPANGSRTIVDQQPEIDLSVSKIADFLLDDVELVLTDGQFAPVAIALLRLARQRAIPTVLDGGSWKPGTRDLLPLTDYAIVSERFRVPDQNDNDPIDCLHRLGPGNVAVTRGAGPIEWSNACRRGVVKPPLVEAVDTLGAGDIFHGAFCHYLARGADFAKALELAAAIAASSCTEFGTRAWIGTIEPQYG